MFTFAINDIYYNVPTVPTSFILQFLVLICVPGADVTLSVAKKVYKKLTMWRNPASNATLSDLAGSAGLDAGSNSFVDKAVADDRFIANPLRSRSKPHPNLESEVVDVEMVTKT